MGKNIEWPVRSNKQKLFALVGKAYNFVDNIFDKSKSFDFETNVEVADLLDTPNFSSESAVLYQAHRSFYLKILINDVLRIDNQFENFIDIGCGKGKTCIKAAKFLNAKKLLALIFLKS